MSDPKTPMHEAAKAYDQLERWRLQEIETARKAVARIAERYEAKRMALKAGLSPAARMVISGQVEKS